MSLGEIGLNLQNWIITIAIAWHDDTVQGRPPFRAKGGEIFVAVIQRDKDPASELLLEAEQAVEDTLASDGN